MAHVKPIEELVLLCSETCKLLSNNSSAESNENFNSNNKSIDKGLRRLFSHKKSRQQKRTSTELNELGKIRTKLRILLPILPDTGPLDHLKQELTWVTTELNRVGPSTDAPKLIESLTRCTFALRRLGAGQSTGGVLSPSAAKPQGAGSVDTPICSSDAPSTPLRSTNTQLPPTPLSIRSVRSNATSEDCSGKPTPTLSRSATHKGVLPSRLPPTPSVKQPVLPATTRASSARKHIGLGTDPKTPLTPQEEQARRFRDIEARMTRAGLGAPILSSSTKKSESKPSRPPPTPTRSAAVRQLMAINTMKKLTSPTPSSSSALEAVLSPTSCNVPVDASMSGCELKSTEQTVVLDSAMTLRERRRSKLESSGKAKISVGDDDGSGVPSGQCEIQAVTEPAPPLPLRPLEVRSPTVIAQPIVEAEVSVVGAAINTFGEKVSHVEALSECDAEDVCVDETAAAAASTGNAEDSRVKTLLPECNAEDVCVDETAASAASTGNAEDSRVKALLSECNAEDVCVDETAASAASTGNAEDSRVKAFLPECNAEDVCVDETAGNIVKNLDVEDESQSECTATVIPVVEVSDNCTTNAESARVDHHEESAQVQVYESNSGFSESSTQNEVPPEEVLEDSESRIKDHKPVEAESKRTTAVDELKTSCTADDEVQPESTSQSNNEENDAQSPFPESDSQQSVEKENSIQDYMLDEANNTCQSIASCDLPISAQQEEHLSESRLTSVKDSDCCAGDNTTIQSEGFDCCAEDNTTTQGARMTNNTLKAALARERARRQQHSTALREALRDERRRRKKGDNDLKLNVVNECSSTTSHEGSQEELLGRFLSHGIRLAVHEASHMPLRELIEKDFKEEIKHTPYIEVKPGVGIQYTIKDLCPLVFRTLRSRNNVNDHEFLESIAAQQLVGGGEGAGKSGSIFFNSHDNQFILKEVKKPEKDVLMDILGSYYNHLETYKYTFLPRFHGLYTMDAPVLNSGKPITIVVMRNILRPVPWAIGASEECEEAMNTLIASNHDIAEVYDLKGSVDKRFTASTLCPPPPSTRRSSSHGPVTQLNADTQPTTRRHARTRSLNSVEGDMSSFMVQNSTTSSPGETGSRIRRHGSLDSGLPMMASHKLGRRNSAPCVLKDLNLRCKFKLGYERKRAIVAQLDIDSLFLQEHNIMDYSLLLGVQSSVSLKSPQSCMGEVESMDESCDDGSFHTPKVSRHARFPSLALELQDDSPLSVLETPSSEVHAVISRAHAERVQCAGLLPEGARVDVVFRDYANCKKSRQSTRFYLPKKKTLYAWQVTRIDLEDDLNSVYEDEHALHRERSSFPFSDDDDDETGLSSNSGRQRSWIIFRRYKEFEKLHRALVEEVHQNQSSRTIPELPAKSFKNNLSPEFIQKRAMELEDWLQHILELLGNQGGIFPALREFLTLGANKYPQGWNAVAHNLLATSDQVGAAAFGSDVQNSPSSTNQPDVSQITEAPPTPLPAPPPLSKSSFLDAPDSTPRPPTATSVGTQSSTPGMSTWPNGARNMDEVQQLLQDTDLWENQLGGINHSGIQAQRVAMVNHGSRPPVQLYMGVIDVLQRYTISKQFESVYKGFTQHADGISAVDSTTYRQRFMDYIRNSVLKS